MLCKCTADIPSLRSLQMSMKPDVLPDLKYEGVALIRESVLRLGANRIVGYQVGNEPDWFVANRGWNVTHYMRAGGYYDRWGDAGSDTRVWDHVYRRAQLVCCRLELGRNASHAPCLQMWGMCNAQTL